jgi:hypothetical protein
MEIYFYNKAGKGSVTQFVVAAESLKSAAKIFGLSTYQLKQIGGTINTEYVQDCLREPGVVFELQNKVLTRWVK